MYIKQAITLEQQVEQLKQRGMDIPDAEEASHYLSTISYYRLAGYWWPMQSDKEAHVFKRNTRFSDVIHLYNFDRELRILLFGIIERIEISLRTKLIYHLSHEFDPWWFQRSEIFTNTREFAKTLSAFESEIERCKDVFIKEHFKKHKDDQRFPPAWKTLEITSFGALSKIYGNLKPNLVSKDTIAQEFGTVNHSYLPSWLQSLVQIRNYCAHHSRLWNKNLPGRPKLLANPPDPWIKTIPLEKEMHMLYIHLCCMKYLLNRIDPHNNFTLQLRNLLDKYPNVDQSALGMKPGWINENLWSQ